MIRQTSLRGYLIVSVASFFVILGSTSLVKAEEIYDRFETKAEQEGRLHVSIKGLRSSDGVVKVGLYNSAKAYTTHKGSFRKAELSIVDKSCEWVIEGVPNGEYALMLYHDKNGNRKLDKNFFGIPNEPYAFSNDAKPRLGLPSFEAVKFLVDATATTLEVNMQ